MGLMILPPQGCRVPAVRHAGSRSVSSSWILAWMVFQNALELRQLDGLLVRLRLYYRRYWNGCTTGLCGGPPRRAGLGGPVEPELLEAVAQLGAAQGEDGIGAGDDLQGAGEVLAGEIPDPHAPSPRITWMAALSIAAG
jgi:hypothetical protein